MCVCSCFHINLNISFIYKEIFTKFPGHIYGYENVSVQYFGLILKNIMATKADHEDALNLKIYHLAAPNLHKRYMARKASLMVTWPSFKNKIVAISRFNVKSP